MAENEDGNIHGMYILHPNGRGRCSHIANASYCVEAKSRGLKIGEKLVLDSIQPSKDAGFRILQFNCVVEGNTAARNLYARLGFKQIGTIEGGLQIKDGSYVNTITEKELVKKLREKYTKNPPEGMTADMIKRMRDSDLLDMDYFFT